MTETSLLHNHAEIIESIIKRIDKLEQDIKFIRTKFLCEDYIINSINKNKRTPFKCPVCDGQPIKELKITKTESGLDKLVLECHGCNGSGIVWG